MNTFAFDFHGTLTDHPALRTQAAVLIAQGNYVHVISAIAANDPNEAKYRERIASWGIPFSGVHFIRFEGQIQPNGKLEYQVGLMKYSKMCEVGAMLLVDDNPHICRAVRDSGRLAVWIGG